ncbi:MAG: Carbohydrate kinase family protein [Patescibacteria group bacterium]|jgi:ribokinase|nr:Carbohydrate kinase family protein [Patescibacteria group bacterium]
MSNNIQVLSIGDVVTDAFIELLPSEAEIDHDNKKHPLLCMTYGTKIPFKDAIIVNGVGNAANAAVAFSRLGMHSAFMSNIGDDKVGRDILKDLHSNNVSTEFVHTNMGKKSNYHYVLWYKSDRTILIKHERYDYKWPEIRKYQTPEWIYLSSIGDSGGPIHDHLDKYLKDNPSVKLAFQPGTFQIREGLKKLKGLYAKSDIIAANKEEFQQILETQSDNEKTLINKMHALGPKIVLLTDGPKGAFASDGKQVVFMPPYPDPKPPLDRTGAGDSYTSTFTYAMMQGKSMQDALAWAGVNSMSVVGQVGAQAGLLDEDEIKIWLKKAPKKYSAKVL